MITDPPPPLIHPRYLHDIPPSIIHLFLLDLGRSVSHVSLHLCFFTTRPLTNTTAIKFYTYRTISSVQRGEKCISPMPFALPVGGENEINHLHDHTV